jgi:small conductance mechanosensitive channel
MEQEIEQVTEIYNLITTYLVTYSFQILGAIIIMSIGVFIARKTGNFVFDIAEKRGLDITLSRFFASFTKIAIPFPQREVRLLQ